jgi:hypothetical protein
MTLTAKYVYATLEVVMASAGFGSGRRTSAGFSALLPKMCNLPE